MLREKRRVEAQTKLLQAQLQDCPDGKLICTHTGKYSKWYQSDGHILTYIPKKEKQLAEKLAAKKLLSLQLKNLLCEQKAIDFYLRHHNQKIYEDEMALLHSPHYHELLSPFFKLSSQELSEWVNSPYEKSTLYPEALKHRTASGIFVRSKSEALIDMFLYKNQIPFRYECALKLGDILIYPDFTIRHPGTGDYYYWEHFGMMDDLTYSHQAFSKLQRYTSHGIIPNIHLITTYETKDFPLSAATVERLVQQYFIDG